jgi:thiamine biosynthesis lipoprotein
VINYPTQRTIGRIDFENMDLLTSRCIQVAARRLYSKTSLVHLLSTGFWLILSAITHGQHAQQDVAQSQIDLSNKEVRQLADGFEYTFPAMGTLVELTVYCPEPKLVQDVFEKVRQQVHELAGILTDYDPNSETRRLTDLAIENPTEVSDPLWTVLVSADSWHQESQGALDCSIGALTSLWRKHRRAHRVPTAEAVQEALEHSGWEHVHLDSKNQTLKLDRQHIRLDFGAIGKGFIVDRIFQTIQEQGIQSCLVNISGNMRCGSPPSGRDAWRIAISPAQPGGQPVKRIAIRDVAIATSGDLWQYTIVEGQRRSHILDPSTGYGVPGPLAVTVIAPAAIDADALATIGCVMPWSQFEELIQRHPNHHALRSSVEDQRTVIRSTVNFPEQDVD